MNECVFQSTLQLKEGYCFAQRLSAHHTMSHHATALLKMQLPGKKTGSYCEVVVFYMIN